MKNLIDFERNEKISNFFHGIFIVRRNK